jgi:predicted membrane protein
MNHQRRNGHVWAGTLLLVIGSLLFTRALGVPYPSWLFTWPVLLISIGLFIGLRHGFRVGGWIIPIIIGSIFLAERFIAGASFKPIIAPAIIISLGILFIFRPRGRHFRTRGFGEEIDREAYPASGLTGDESSNFSDRRDFIDTTSIFGGVKKIVLSKNFKGGDLVNFMGGSEINLTQSDFSGSVRIETTNVFGGTKLIVPSTWDVQSEVVAIFGGVDDKRHFNGASVDPSKVLIIEGTCLFGGIEIRSF